MAVTDVLEDARTLSCSGHGDYSKEVVNYFYWDWETHEDISRVNLRNSRVGFEFYVRKCDTKNGEKDPEPDARICPRRGLLSNEYCGARGNPKGDGRA